jgi:RIO kinase 1
MLLRDVENMARYFGRFAPQLRRTEYGREIWSLYEKGQLRPDSRLTGQFEGNLQSADVDEVLRIIAHAREEAEQELERRRAALED